MTPRIDGKLGFVLYNGPMEIQLYSLPHEQRLELLKRNLPVYVLVNPIEYHGPHLSLHTDGEISLGMARKLHQSLCKSQGDMPLVIAENIALGESPTMGPGSIHTPYKDLRKIILRTSKSLLKQGVKKVIFMTFHGGPMHNMAIHEGVKFLQSNGVKAINPFNLIIHKMLNFNPENYQAIREFLPDNCNHDHIIEHFNYDFHAGIFETSLCLYLCPQTVGENYKLIPHCPAFISNKFLMGISRFFEKMGRDYLSKELRFAALGLSWIQLRPFPGYSGTPSYSSKELGDYFVNQDLIPLYNEATVQTLYHQKMTPQPIMKWIKYLTLGGLLHI